MTNALPPVLALHRLVVARAKTMEPKVLVFGLVPPDESSRGVPYVIVDADAGSDRVTRGDGAVSARTGRFRLRCVGSTIEQALLAVDEARACFRDWRPYLSPRFGAARETDSDPLDVDRTIPTDVRYLLGLTYEVAD